MFFVNPFRERGALRLLSAAMLMFALRGLRAAVFTEPAITQIEEMGRLVHRNLFKLPRGSRFHQPHRHSHSPAVAPDLHLHSLTDLVLFENAEEFV